MDALRASVLFVFLALVPFDSQGVSEYSYTLIKLLRGYLCISELTEFVDLEWDILEFNEFLEYDLKGLRSDSTEI